MTGATTLSRLRVVETDEARFISADPEVAQLMKDFEAGFIQFLDLENPIWNFS